MDCLGLLIAKSATNLNVDSFRRNFEDKPVLARPFSGSKLKTDSGWAGTDGCCSG